ncbi:MAG: UDP-N-acetylglucosamine 2-epimerase (non-hydrolyzing), partial [Rubrivivax sp.]
MKYPSRLPALQSSFTGLFQHDRSQTRPGTPALPVLCVVGTRPEAIKMAPVIRTLSTSGWATPVTVATGQQQSLLDDALADFDIRVNVRLPHTGASHSPASFLAHCLSEVDEQISLRQPAAVIAQGDTTSVHAAAMAAFYRRIPFVHVEAGLRTGDMDAPFPEEYHRRAVALATLLHCAPTQAAAANLRREGIAEARILVSGNTVIDALLATAARRPPLPLGFPPASAQQRVILLTLHRRENFGPNIHNALTAVRAFVDAHADVAVWFPVHPNPNARDVVHSLLSGHPRIHLVEPMPYRDLVAVMGACWCVLTDSGGLQEEAPALGKPVLV